MHYGRKLKAKRVECGLTQAEAAALLKQDPKIIIAWERAKLPVSCEDFEAMAAIYDKNAKPFPDCVTATGRSK